MAGGVAGQGEPDRRAVIVVAGPRAWLLRRNTGRPHRPGRSPGRRYPATTADITELDTPAGTPAFTDAYVAAFGNLGPGHRARHLSIVVPRWPGRPHGWLAADPTAGCAWPKVPMDTPGR